MVKAKKASALRLENLRRADTGFEALSPKTQKQVKFLLKQEGNETLAQARKNDESIFLGMEVIDVIDEATGKAKYQMFLFGSSDGYVLGADNTKAIAEIPQHDFLLLEFDPALHAQFEAAWKEGAKRLKIEHSVDFHEPRPRQPKAPASKQLSFAERLAQLEARRAAAGPTNQDIWKNDNLLSPHTIQLVRDTLEPFRSLPARRPFELTADQRAALTFFVSCDFRDMELWMYGLPPKYSPEPESALHRLLGLAPPTARDATVAIDNQPHPILCLVSDVVHDLKTPEIVLDLLFAQLAVETLVTALQELIARREDTYQRQFVFTSLASFIKDGEDVTTHQIELVRYADFLAAWALRLGDRNPLSLTDPKLIERGPFEIVVAMTTALARGEALGPEHDALFTKLETGFTPGEMKPLRRATVRLLKTLPLERALVVAPTRKILLTGTAAEIKKASAWLA